MGDNAHHDPLPPLRRADLRLHHTHAPAPDHPRPAFAPWVLAARGCVGAGVGRARSVGLCLIFTEQNNYVLFFGLDSIAFRLGLLWQKVEQRFRKTNSSTNPISLNPHLNPHLNQRNLDRNNLTNQTNFYHQIFLSLTMLLNLASKLCEIHGEFLSFPSRDTPRLLL